MTATLALRRGACPSVAAPMRTGDGLLVRLRPAAPALTAEDLVALADLARETGNGLIEITARGNLQLRGLDEASVPRLVEGLAAAGIVPLTGIAIEVPPLAGIDPSEITDAAPLAAELRAEIARAALTLAPKLAIVVDGGGVLCLADMVADIRLDAVAGPQNVLWQLSVGGNRATARAVALLAKDVAVRSVLAVLNSLAAEGPAARGRDLDAAALSALLGGKPAEVLPATASANPLGRHESGGEILLGIAPAYGQVHADRLIALAKGLSAVGAKRFYLAPHRTLLVRGLASEALASACTLAERGGFWCTGDAPGRSISICAGSAGCASATFDTHAAADAVVALAGTLLDGSADLHISGCPKGCAHPAAAAVTLCGTAAGVGLVLGGRASDTPAASVAAADLKPAIERLGTLFRTRRTEGETARSLIDRTAPATLVSAYQGRS